MSTDGEPQVRVKVCSPERGLSYYTPVHHLYDKHSNVWLSPDVDTLSLATLSKDPRAQENLQSVHLYSGASFHHMTTCQSLSVSSLEFTSPCRSCRLEPIKPIPAIQQALVATSCAVHQRTEFLTNSLLATYLPSKARLGL